MPVISGSVKGAYPGKEYVPIGPLVAAVGLLRQKPPVKELVVVALTLQPLTIIVEVE